MKREFAASVTFESASAAPETWRGAIVAGSPQKAASEAVRAAKKALPGKQWASFVVLIEKREA